MRPLLGQQFPGLGKITHRREIPFEERAFEAAPIAGCVQDRDVFVAGASNRETSPAKRLDDVVSCFDHALTRFCIDERGNVGAQVCAFLSIFEEMRGKPDGTGASRIIRVGDMEFIIDKLYEACRRFHESIVAAG